MRGRKLILTAALASVFYSAGLFAGQAQGDEDQQKAQEQNPPPMDLQSLRAQAQLGDIAALLKLGKMYAVGDLVAKDLPQAYRLFDQAAKKGSDIGRFAAATIRFVGGQHTTPPDRNEKNFDLENCPESSPFPNEYIEKFTSGQRRFDRLTEWPISFDYFVIEDPKSSNKIDIRATFESKYKNEKPIGTCFLSNISDYFFSTLNGAWRGSEEDASAFMLEYANEQIAQHGKHDQMPTWRPFPWEVPGWKGLKKYYDESASKPYQARPICRNNYNNQFFDITQGRANIVDFDGNFLRNQFFNGKERKPIFLPQDKAGNSFVIARGSARLLLTIEDFISGNFDTSSETTGRLYFSGKDGLSGGYNEYGYLRFSENGRGLLFLFRKQELGFYCSYKKAPGLEF